ncbi:UDP-N-acetylmuramoyl-tripeptide--D-alanyl-D-alanine ligase [Blautia sp. Marseille-P3201T]|uniref:UDP-N-acetylmuramoyl-tripeptide--D-alanyl-D- alanine ligase n=1 Tax=Blautia sp. Marseille-P3201T TaxID=1907659 RepID=UPI0009302A13|nr:UDP-N-acetylmuramoyl-tripeptide--D-alanyl-D-alanine ligase [Blautia sp. Marseille-P3201T]
MKNLTLKNLALACNGTYVGAKEAENKEITCIFTDSRKAEAGGLFVPIKGARVDAHDFIEQVMEKEVLATLSEKDLGEKPFPYILVESSLAAVKDIAEFYLKQLQIPVVGITGSVGKTSTKEVIASVLAQKYNTLKTQGNFNNELGLPLTIFRLRDEHEMAVLEMGISDFGEMHRLAKIARPNTCVITNIGLCHLEFLKSRDGILKAKTEIFDYLQPDGHIILNGDDDKLVTVQEAKGIKPVFFGVENHQGIWADEIKPEGLKGISCCIHAGEESFSVLIPVPGKHSVYNALAATAVGLTYGLTIEEIRRGIESLQSVSGRFHIIETPKYTVIDDCYNANPISMKASLDVLTDALGRKVAILGDMGELGADERKMHQEVGKYAAEKEIDVLLCVGELSTDMAEAAKAVNSKTQVRHFTNKENLMKEIPEILEKGDTVLVKASHFMEFGEIVEKLS